MWISKAGAYAIRVAIYLAAEAVPGPVSVRQIAAALDLPYSFLNKICQQLARGGILTAARGSRGGVCLARPRPEVTLLDIVQVIEGRPQSAQCLLGLDGCGRSPACAVHQPWQAIQRQFIELLEMTDLELLSRKVRQEGLRLGNETSPRSREGKGGQPTGRQRNRNGRGESRGRRSRVSEGGADGR